MKRLLAGMMILMVSSFTSSQQQPAAALLQPEVAQEMTLDGLLEAVRTGRVARFEKSRKQAKQWLKFIDGEERRIAAFEL